MDLQYRQKYKNGLPIQTEFKWKPSDRYIDRYHQNRKNENKNLSLAVEILKVTLYPPFGRKRKRKRERNKERGSGNIIERDRLITQ